MSEPHILTTRLIQGERDHLEVDQAELEVTDGPERGARLPLGLATRTIGTSSRCDLVLTDPTISSTHAEVSVRDGAHVLRDTGSKNGVYLEGWRVTAVPLASGMKLRLGSTTLAVRATGETETVALAAPATGDMIARSVAMRAVIAQLDRFAPSDITILLEGETGVGKDVLARYAHAASQRVNGPFVPVDCGAISPSLLASELFGHIAGAFTGASKTREGMVSAAEGGTLFLDEIGELPIDLQPMLLRLLEQRTSRAVGATRESHHDIRVIAATNRNLGEEVRARRFRQDLYYRLAVGAVRVPPLRDRQADIPLLVERFAAESGARISREVVRALAAYHWPGNVRELRNAVHRIAVMPDMALDRVVQTVPERSRLAMPQAREEAIAEFEREYVSSVLLAAGGSVSRAAELAGVSRQYLYRLITEHDIGRSGGGDDDDGER